MANRLVGNVYILDTSTDNLVWPSDARVGSIAFYGVDTTARLVLSHAATTSDAICAFGPPGNSVLPWSAERHLGGVEFRQQVRVQQLTAGTGWIYFV